MKTIPVASLKVTLSFKAGNLPKINPADPIFVLAMGTVRIQGRVNAKAARKLAVWQGSACLQGKLIVEGGRLVLTEAGFLFNDPRPAAAAVQSGRFGPTAARF